MAKNQSVGLFWIENCEERNVPLSFLKCQSNSYEIESMVSHNYVCPEGVLKKRYIWDMDLKSVALWRAMIPYILKGTWC